MTKQYHVLNGDCLKEQLPATITGELIVARECLVEGHVQGDSLAVFFQSRAQYISSHYDDVSESDYFDKTATEFEKILAIEGDVEINLWFEDDLFCQVNFWFVMYLLSKSHQYYPIYLVRPKEHSQHGFGGLTEVELTAAYDSRLPLTEVKELAQLWTHYQEGDLEGLHHTATALRSRYPFILPAVEAHIDRLPAEGNLGRPIESLMQIIDELGTEEFAPVFQAFCKRESIYGYGDVQVRKLLEQIRKTRAD